MPFEGRKESAWLRMPFIFQTFGPDEVIELPPNTETDGIKIVINPVDESEDITFAVDVFACFEEGI